MVTTWAVVGKGGTGKTTVSALMLKHFLATGQTPVLVVDADPNYNLNDLLLIDVPTTIGDIRENLREKVKDQDAAISKREFFEYQILQNLSEKAGFDFLVMGRSQGKGCYCYVNNVLKEILTKLTSSYKTILIDCEAGLEHLSRGTMGQVDNMVIVSDHSQKGIKTAGRMATLVDDLEVPIANKFLVVNRVFDEGDKEQIGQLAGGVCANGTRFLGTIPEDTFVLDFERNGKSF